MTTPNSEIRNKAIVDTKIKALSDERKVRVIASTATEDRAGDVVRAEGIDLTRYRTNPVVLFNHDKNHPVARCIEIGVKGGRLEAVVQFHDEGVSAKSDEVYGLIKAGVLNAVSIGFIGSDVEKYGDFGLDFKSSELLEFSFVSVPANPDALIIERALGDQAGQLLGAEQIELLQKNIAALKEAHKAMTFEEANTRIETSEDLWELYDALWQSWRSIDEDGDMDDAAKQAAKLVAFDAYASAVRVLIAGEGEIVAGDDGNKGVDDAAAQNKSVEADNADDLTEYAARLKVLKLRGV